MSTVDPRALPWPPQVSTSATPGPNESPSPTPVSEFWTINVVELLQIAFWVTLGVIAILTYRQARRTLLQPLRTEVYKLQLTEMKDLLAIFVGKGEMGLVRHFDLDGVLDANASALVDAYASGELGAEVKDPDDRPYSPKNCPGGMIVMPSDEVVELMGLVRPDETSSYETDVTSDWASRRVTMVHLTHGYYAAEDGLESFLSDPLIPGELADLIQKFLDAVRNNVSSMLTVLNGVSPSLPELFPSIESLESLQMAGLHNDWNRCRPSLEPLAQEIITYARAYFASDAFKSGVAKR